LAEAGADVAQAGEEFQETEEADGLSAEPEAARAMTVILDASAEEFADVAEEAQEGEEADEIAEEVEEPSEE
jgi:hypothetical protein